MKQIDLNPVDYRTRDPKSGRWVEHVNKPLCRWGALVSLAWCGYFAIRSWSEWGTPWVVIAVTMTAFAAGALFTLSLKSIDW